MRQFVRVSVGLLLLAVLVGCGPPRSRAGVVSGKVTYKGRPVGGAALLLYPTDGDLTDPITIPVTEDGEFRIADTPPGEYKVVVQGTAGAAEADLSGMPADKRAKAKEMLGKMNTPPTIPFPNKYKDQRTTDLRCTITEKNQTLDLELTD
jgi:hypothetical protein